MRFFIVAGFICNSLLISTSARAEYRAFRLVITDTRTGQTRSVTSSVDDIQYPGYHHLHAWETIAIQDTWMCWGRQGDFKPICPNPNTQDASGPSAKSTGLPAGGSAAP